MIHIKSQREISLMRDTCHLAAETLIFLMDKVVPGISTEEINTVCHEYIVSHGAYPSTLNYNGFPKSLCTSPNHVVCHGIPSPKVIVKEGDILNLDVTTTLKSFFGDTNCTFFVGEKIAPEVRNLVKHTYEAMMLGIKEVRPGARLGNVGAAIQEYAEDLGYSVVRDYCGHGIGRNFHEEPQVVHFGKRNTGIEIRPGMTFTIEPMINLGKKETKVLKDDWTVETKDGKWSAQFEHTILVTEAGFEILTVAKDGRSAGQMVRDSIS